MKDLIIFTNLSLSKFTLTISLLILAIMIDVITGLLKSKISGNINSKIGYKGLWKKLSLIIAVSFGFFLDLIGQYILQTNFYQSTSNLSLGFLISIYIILNESISIYENLSSCDVKIPQIVIQFLKKLTNIIETTKKK